MKHTPYLLSLGLLLCVSVGIKAQQNHVNIDWRPQKNTDISFPTLNKEFKNCIIPFIESRYKVIENPHGRAICGL